jgi:hypothetical protein
MSSGESTLTEEFQENAKPGFWHRVHVGLNGIHEGVSHVIGDVAGVAAGAAGLVVDFADMGAEMIGKDLYGGNENISAANQWFKKANSWTKENVGDKLAYAIVPPAAVADMFNGFQRAELLDETDEQIFSVAEIGTRVAGDAAIVAGAVILSGGTVAGAAAGTISTTAAAAKTTLGLAWTTTKLTALTGGGTLLLGGLAYGADRLLPTKGALTHGVLQIPEKVAEIIGWERAANFIDTASDKMEVKFDNENNQQPTLNDVTRAAYDGRRELWQIPEEQRTEDDTKSTLRLMFEDAAEGASKLGDSMLDWLAESDTLKATFNWLGSGSMGSLLAIGATTLFGGNFIFDRLLGNNFFSGILTFGATIAAVTLLPKAFKSVANRNPNTSSEEQNAQNPAEESTSTDNTEISYSPATQPA